MPNWCSTAYIVTGDPKEVRELRDIIKFCLKRKTPVIKNGFGVNWIGCVITKMGFHWEDYHCRGSIEGWYYDKKTNTLSIDQETAWGEAEGFRECINLKFPSLNVYYQLIEPGMGIYVTNSFEHFSKYYLVSYEDCEFYNTLEEAKEDCINITGNPNVLPIVDSIVAAYENYVVHKEEENEDVFFSFHEFQLCND